MGAGVCPELFDGDLRGRRQYTEILMLSSSGIETAAHDERTNNASFLNGGGFIDKVESRKRFDPVAPGSGTGKPS